MAKDREAQITVWFNLTFGLFMSLAFYFITVPTNKQLAIKNTSNDINDSYISLRVVSEITSQIFGNAVKITTYSAFITFIDVILNVDFMNYNATKLIKKERYEGFLLVFRILVFVGVLLHFGSVIILTSFLHAKDLTINFHQYYALFPFVFGYPLLFIVILLTIILKIFVRKLFRKSVSGKIQKHQ
ncbi:predicted protein [Naegleria gruberi]|uniref:Predicted protein n=1 Tax=Naegleria gruberi TaxID=5762 RepID=D2UZN5_NAEGR|nr:uncharacterized protein NAEGRDRAFT_62004 [Naegleria gruberi]EFC50190.1 predicted protein [Naegleria gruberi]|eukprot:XP_002682934.1 predicted protein [Naegleria gruberi strain NEG-M]